MEKYLHYSSEDFSQEESFIRWVKGKRVIDDIDWSNWIELHPEKSEDVANAKRLVMNMKFKHLTVSTETEEKVWSKISTEINESTSSTKPKKNNIRRFWYGAAAAIVLFLFMVNLGGEFDTTIKTSVAQIETMSLPDGSQVTLNADTKLSYNKGSWSEKRALRLSGEAFFEVEKGSKFTVYTNNGNIEVLGTSFNVLARGKSLSVECETGKVGVIAAEKQTILTPQQAVIVMQRDHGQITSINNQNRRSNWKTGIYVYKETPISEVIQELERQLKVDIIIDESLTNVNYSGSFNKANIDSALSEVFWPIGLKYVQSGNQVTVTN